MMWTKINIVLVFWTSCYNTFVSEEHQVIGSSHDVVFREKEDVILPCHIEPPVNMEDQTVEWTRPDLKQTSPDQKTVYVHLRQDGRYKFNYTNELYKHRTSLFEEELTHGNISLKLYRARLSDEGMYRCSAKTNKVPYRYSEVRLIVAQEEIDIPPQGVLRLRPDYSSITTSIIKSILWKHGEISAVEWNHLPPDSFTYYYKTIKERAVLNTSTAELVINNMTTSDGGNYFVEINSQPLSKSYMVKVMKKVPKPVVFTNPPCDSNSTSCEVECLSVRGDVREYGSVTYRWKKDEVNVSDSGPNSNRLIVTRDEKVKTLTCEVQNELGMEQSDPYLNLLYKEPTPEPTFTGGIGIIVGVIVTLVVVLIVGLVVRWCWVKHPDRIKKLPCCPQRDGGTGRGTNGDGVELEEITPMSQNNAAHSAGAQTTCWNCFN